MRKDMDKIIMEHRSEVDNVECALQEWFEEHKSDTKSEDVKKLISLLDAMYMSW